MRTPKQTDSGTRFPVPRLVTGGALLLAALLLAGSARAGVPAPRPGIAPGKSPGAPGAPAKPEVKKDIFDEKPDKHYEQGERVDPFTLGKPPKPPLPPPPPKKPNGRPPPPRDPWGRKLRKVNDAYTATELLLSAATPDRFTTCISQSETQLSALRSYVRDLRKSNKPAETAYLNDFLEAQEQFQRLVATAQRLQRRQAVEADFKSKKIVVQGIVWRPQSPAAAVNGQVVTEGKTLELGGPKGGRIQVYRIRKGSVIFLYRGIQVSAHLQRGM